MAKATTVNSSPSKTIATNPPSLLDCVENICEEDDESRELGSWLASLEGETKEKVNALLRQLDNANSLIDEKEEIIVTLENHGGCHSSGNKGLEEAFEKERSIRASLEEKLSSLEETYAICVSKLRKDNELTLALVKTRENEKVELGIAHDRLVDEHEKLEKDFMSLKEIHGKLIKSRDQLLAQHSNKQVMSSTSTSTDRKSVV